MNRKFRIAAIVALAAFGYAGVAAAGNPAQGREKSKPCAACHGDTGMSSAADFPRLAGQHADYLERALREYKSGVRKNPVMAGQVTSLTPADMADLAAFYASQQGLTTRR
jgi:cytochrome c553